MKKLLLGIIGLLILGVITYLAFFKQKTGSGSNKKDPATDGYFISTQTESDDRIRKLGLDKPSEDASALLDTNKLAVPKEAIETGEKDYKGNPEREWIINVDAPNGTIFKKADLNKLFDKEWNKTYTAATVYGYTANGKRWTFVMAADAPEAYGKIQVGINLLEVYNTEKPDYAPEKLEKYISGLTLKLSPLGAKPEPVEPIGKAVAKSKQLVELNHEFDQEAFIRLRSKAPLKGVLVWDVLTSTGLKWGDGDLFHWGNNRRDYGGDQLFSVGTSTDPGYFLPEQIKSGEMNPADLIFGFSVPRSADPENVFPIMINAVKYCQKRLGGEILNKSGQPFEEVKEKAELADLVRKMKSKGIVPGSHNALTLY